MNGDESLRLFQEAVRNLREFNAGLATVNDRFGSLADRVVALENSLGGMRNASSSTPRTFKERIGKEQGGTARTDSDVAASAGTAINELILAMIQNKIADLKTFKSTGGSKLNEEVLSTLNKQIIRLVQAQVANVLRTIGKGDAENIPEEARKGLKETIETENYRHISNKIINDQASQAEASFSGFGFGGAIVNKVRSMMAGSIESATQKFIDQGMESLLAAQQEQQKIMQNLIAKENPIVMENGEKAINFGAVEADVKGFKPHVENNSITHALNETQSWKAVGTASRFIRKPEESGKYLDIAGRIKAIDPGANLETTALGLNALMSKFNKGVFQLSAPGTGRPDIVRIIAALQGNVNVDSNNLFKALQENGSLFSKNKVEFDKAAIMAAVSMDSTESANIGDLWKNAIEKSKSKLVEDELKKEVKIDSYETDEAGNRKFKGLHKLLYELAGAGDERKQKAIMGKIFGTSPDGKELFDLKKYKEIVDRMAQMREEDIEAMVAKGANSPNAVLDRAEISVRLAFLNVMEDLLPQITAVADGVTNLANIIRDNSGIVAGLVNVMSSVLIGFLAIRGIRAGFNKFGYQEAANLSRTRANLLGDPGIPFSGMFAKNGNLRNVGYGIAPELLALHGKNYERFTEALKNPTLSPHLNKIAGFDEKRMAQMADYFVDTYRRPIQTMEELIMASQMSEGYSKPSKMTRDELYERSNVAINRLHANLGDDSPPGSKSFMKNMMNELGNSKRFDSLNSSEKGASVINRLAGMNAEEVDKFSSHLQQMNKQTGFTVNSLDGLTDALDRYSVEQIKAQQGTVKAKPEFMSLSEAIAEVDRKVSSGTNKGLASFKKLLSDLPSVARGAGTAINSLVGTLGKMTPQLMAFAAIGEIIKNVTYSVTATDSQKKVDSITRDFSVVDRIEGIINDSNGGISKLGDYLLKDWIFPFVADYGNLFGGNYIGNEQLQDMYKNISTFIEDKYGAKVTASWIGIDRFARDNGMTVEQVLNEYKSYGGSNSLLTQKSNADRELFSEQYKESKIKEEQERLFREEEDKKSEQKMREDLEKGKYSDYSAQTVQAYLKDSIGKKRNEIEVHMLENMANGKKTYDEEFIKEREKLSNELIGIYDSATNNIQKVINDLNTKIKEHEEAGTTNSSEYQQLLSNRDHMIRVQKEVNETIGKERHQEKSKTDQDFFNIRMNRINREANLNELRMQALEYSRNITMDRNSKAYLDASIQDSQEKVRLYRNELAMLEADSGVGDNDGTLDIRKAEVRNKIDAERERQKGLRLSSLAAIRIPMEEKLADMDNEYLSLRAKTGAEEDSPLMKSFRINLNKSKVAEYQTTIANYERELKSSSNPEDRTDIQQQIRDLTRQSLQAQIGIWDELKSQSGTFNIPDGIKPMSYYEHITRNSSHKAYTVQGGDVNVQVVLPNVTEKTTDEQLRRIGAGLGRGIGDGSDGGLRLQQFGNPFPVYRSGA